MSHSRKFPVSIFAIYKYSLSGAKTLPHFQQREASCADRHLQRGQQWIFIGKRPHCGHLIVLS